MSKTGTHKIRPAGRLILTIGRDLIQDPFAAVVELVKNAYDADSHDVDIEFSRIRGEKGYSVTIADHGHGMSRDDVINKWMVPSTPDKLRRRKSPSGRVMQGRKGVGRYAASVLGKDLLLETVSVEGEKTEVYIDWSYFEKSEYLDDIEILVETSDTADPSGTCLTMTGEDVLLSDWNQRQFDRLGFELRRLKSPVGVALSNDDFRINLRVNGFPGVDGISEIIEPYPIFDLFDYRISGSINSEGMGTLEYSMQKIRNSPDESIHFHLGKPTECGDLFLDIRVYDRDRASIDSLIGRGLKDNSGSYVGNLQARQLLNEYNGIGVYRNGFRIRPLGDPDFDWLKLNEQRVQNPSLRIGSNQVIGFVQIQSDEESELIEKSARDGLRENKAFGRLKEITTNVIGELESRRFQYRRQTDLNRPAAKIERELDSLFSYEELRRDVNLKLSRSGVGQETADEIMGIISRDEEEKNKIADDIRQAVAVYQGQATLGKIINVILHEGRRPLNFFRNEIPNLRHWHKSFLSTGDRKTLDRVVSIGDGIGNNAEVFVNLFGRLDPLAAGKRSRKTSLNLKETISGTLSVFSSEMQSQGVESHVDCPDDFMITAWAQDFYSIFTNLIDNSLYWMNEKNSPEQEISVDVVTDGNSLLHIDYRDTGPGIDPGLIASEVIFEPQFSTKPSGTGLGLPIAGEAAARNGLELKAFESEAGAWFRLQAVPENGE